MLVRKSNSNGGAINHGFSNTGEGVRDGIGIPEGWDDPEVFSGSGNPDRVIKTRSTNNNIDLGFEIQFGRRAGFLDAALKSGLSPKSSLPSPLSPAFDSRRGTQSQTRAKSQAEIRSPSELGSHLVIAVGGVIGRSRRRGNDPRGNTGRSGRRSSRSWFGDQSPGRSSGIGSTISERPRDLRIKPIQSQFQGISESTKPVDGGTSSFKQNALSAHANTQQAVKWEIAWKEWERSPMVGKVSNEKSKQKPTTKRPQDKNQKQTQTTTREVTKNSGPDNQDQTNQWTNPTTTT